MEKQSTQMGDDQPLTKCVVCNKAKISTTGRKICEDTECVDTYWRCAALYQETHKGQVN